MHQLAIAITLEVNFRLRRFTSRAAFQRAFCSRRLRLYGFNGRLS